LGLQKAGPYDIMRCDIEIDSPSEGGNAFGLGFETVDERALRAQVVPLAPSYGVMQTGLGTSHSRLSRDRIDSQYVVGEDSKPGLFMNIRRN